MTPFAKMLVFLNLLISSMFTTWTIGMYTHRVDWAPPRTLQGELIEGKQGRLDKLKEDIKDYTDRRDSIERRWQAAFAEVPKVEQHRQNYQNWYADLHLASHTGKDRAGNDVKPPVRELIEVKKNGKSTGELNREEAKPVKIIIEFDKDGKPAKEEELKYAEYYERQFTELSEKLKLQQKELDQLIQEHKELTEKIVGVPKMTQGLVGKRDDQLAYLKNCLIEQRYLLPLRNNIEAEIVLLQKRQAALTARVKELQELAVNR